MLRLPAGGDPIPQLIVAEEDGETEDDGDEIGTEDESGELLPHGERRRRRKRLLTEEELFDETFPDKTELSPAMVRGMIGSVAFLGVLIGAVLLWPHHRPAAPPAGGYVPVAPPEEVVPADEMAAERSVLSPAYVREHIEPLYRAFLDAESIGEMAEVVRHPELTVPRMKEWYGGEFRGPGFGKVVWREVFKRPDGSVSMQVEDADFNPWVIAAVEDGGEWKIDWESWAGWSEMGWEKFRKQKPTDPLRFRVQVNPVGYYNFGFMDEEKWSSYQLLSPDGESSLYGYVPRGGELEAALHSYDRSKNLPFVLELAFPEDAVSDNQVRIERVIVPGWFDPEDR